LPFIKKNFKKLKVEMSVNSSKLKMKFETLF